MGQRIAVIATALVLTALAVLPAAGQAQPVTPPAIVATYSHLADVILAAKGAERQLVLSILAATYDQAVASADRARAKLQSGADAAADLETLAALVSQLGNEGDAAVAGVRKRLIEQGHHHHASGAEEGLYEEGFVVVTRAAKKTFIEAATAIGKLAAAPSAGALDAQWEKVQNQYQQFVSQP